MWGLSTPPPSQIDFDPFLGYPIKVPFEGSYEKMVEIRDDGTMMRTLPKIFSNLLAFSLLLGVFFLPLQAEAQFFTSLFGGEVYAQESSQSDCNNTNCALMAGVSPASGDENNDVNIVLDNTILSVVGTRGMSDGFLGEGLFSDQVTNYKVRDGDSVSAIAKMFGVSVNTIYWANDLKKGDKLKTGQDLIVLPFDGLTHTVKIKETLDGIAKLYDADVADILAFNGLTKEDKLIVGEELVIPDGQKAEERNKTVASSSSSSSPRSSSYSQNLKSVDGYFIYPLPKGPRIRKTQGIHDKYAIDIGAPAGTPIYAAASGSVVIARTGYNGGYGTFVVIKHPNGTESRYAHMSKLGTSTGKQVSQGEVIGFVGTTGRSTGNHLHIEIRGAKNPF